MFAIVGLGNPGEEYKDTRHNAGRLVLEMVLRDWKLPSMIKSSRYDSLMTEGMVNGNDVGVYFPRLYMNESGKSVKRIVNEGRVNELIIVYDDVDLPLGSFKISYDRGNGGHNGVASVIKELDSKEFVRLRVGIAQRSFFGRMIRPTGEKLAAYVLGKLTRSEFSKLEKIAPDIRIALETILKEGKEAAMNKFN